MSQEIRSVFKERNRKRRSRDSLENPDNEHKRKKTDLVKKEVQCAGCNI